MSDSTLGVIPINKAIKKWIEERNCSRPCYVVSDIVRGLMIS
jgi:hypothetical protein